MARLHDILQRALASVGSAPCVPGRTDHTRADHDDGVATSGTASLHRNPHRRTHVRELERNILGYLGIAPVHETLIGLTGNMKSEDAAKWLNKLRRLGFRGD